MSDDEEKSYDPTPKKREQFRKEGRIPRSRDAGAVLAIAAVVGAIAGTRDAMGATVQTLFDRTVGDLTAMTSGETVGVKQSLATALMVLLVPFVVASTLAAVVAGFAQAGVKPNTDQLEIKPERLNPFPKIGQMFNPKHGGVEALLALGKVVCVGSVAASAGLDELPKLLGLWAHDLAGSFRILISTLATLGLKALGAMSLIAAADYAQSYFKLEKEMKMSLKELKDEMRQEDGDPQMKGRMKAKARAIAKKRMMNDVKDATVVVANPTHVSVALRYGPKDGSPIVVAKGHDEVALAIRKKAREHGIPIVENRPLARTLDAEIAIGKPIGVEHFGAVAKILAFVYNLKRGRSGRTASAAR